MLKLPEYTGTVRVSIPGYEIQPRVMCDIGGR